jgi:hypothetical protein
MDELAAIEELEAKTSPSAVHPNAVIWTVDD